MREGPWHWDLPGRRHRPACRYSKDGDWVLGVQLRPGTGVCSTYLDDWL